jgi:ankyrin repeat protein
MPKKRNKRRLPEGFDNSERLSKIAHVDQPPLYNDAVIKHIVQYLNKRKDLTALAHTSRFFYCNSFLQLERWLKLWAEFSDYPNKNTIRKYIADKCGIDQRKKPYLWEYVSALCKWAKIFENIIYAEPATNWRYDIEKFLNAVSGAAAKAASETNLNLELFPGGPPTKTDKQNPNYIIQLKRPHNPLTWLAERGLFRFINIIYDRDCEESEAPQYLEALNFGKGDDGTALFLAIGRNHIKTIKSLAIIAGVDLSIIESNLNYGPSFNTTPFHYLALRNNTNLLGKYIDANFCNNDVRKIFHPEFKLLTKLMILDSRDQFETQLKNIANQNVINFSDSCGWTLLHWSLCLNRKEIFKYLIRQNCDVTYAAQNGISILELACIKGYAEYIDLLPRDLIFYNSLHYAACSGHKECLEKLLPRIENKELIFESDDFDNTPLMIACENDNVECLKLLLDAIKHLSNTEQYKKAINSAKEYCPNGTRCSKLLNSVKFDINILTITI